jgi:diketogulonate reductase-like aldo/keto reductase
MYTMNPAATPPSRSPVHDLGDGVLMPLLGLGVWKVPPGRETEQAVAWALEAGYRHIDTAAAYRNERSVGVALRHSGIARDEVFITTKWMPIKPNPERELARSLERLGLDYVDLYLIHWPMPTTDTRGWHGLEVLRTQGRARAIGVSNYGTDRLTRLLAQATYRPAVNQIQFNPVHFRRRLFEYCLDQGITLEAYSPLDHGRALAHPVIVEIARRLERRPAQVMLRWAIQHEVIVIPKSTHRERILSNAAIFDFMLSPSDMLALDALDTTGGTGKAR